jgi:hypothetical protein
MMAGLEVVVRPVIFPDIRPRAKQSLPPQDDPEKGLAVISGNPAQSIGLSYSWSVSASYSKPKEKWRKVDGVRTFQMKEPEGGGDGGGGGGGGVNRKNYIDTEVATQIAMEEPGGGGDVNPPLGAGGGGQGGGGTPDDLRIYHYQRQREAENIEIRQRDKMRYADD